MNKQAGFTLIELIVVIVILGILGAVALPKFVDLSDKAGQAAVDGVAGAISAASVVNYGACKANDTCVVLTNCDDVIPLLVGGALPANYSLPVGAAAPLGAADSSTNCTLTFTGVSPNVTAQAKVLKP